MTQVKVVGDTFVDNGGIQSFIAHRKVSVKFSNKYISVPVTRNLRCLCKSAAHFQIDNGFCCLQKNVLQFQNFRNVYNDLNECHQSYVDISKVQVHHSAMIQQCKVVEVSIVFSTVASYVFWKKNQTSLGIILNSALSLFVITSNCIIRLRSLTCITLPGIRYIIVHNTAVGKHNPAYITFETIIHFKHLMSLQQFKAMCSVFENTVGGLVEQQKFLENAISPYFKNNCNLKFTNKILLIGPPGCGKSSIVRNVAARVGAILLVVDGMEVANPISGKPEAKLKMVFEQAKTLAENGVCVVLLDNVELIAPKRTHKSGLRTKRLTGHLRRMLDSLSSTSSVVVIAATSSIHLLDGNIRCANRLETELYIGVPSMNERASILEYQCNRLSLSKSACKEVAAWSRGYVASDLSLVVCDVARAVGGLSNVNDVELLAQFKNSLRRRLPSALRCASDIRQYRGGGSEITADLGGMCTVKTTLRHYIEWPLKWPDVFSRFNIRISKGILLYGPPGCGKTSLARSLADSLNLTMLSTSAAELYSAFVGATEQNVMELFNRARANSPCIVFIDEIDALVGKRSGGMKETRQNVLSTFLTEMDGVGCKRDVIQGYTTSEGLRNSSIVIVIAATNRPDKLDDAILRPGRFDKLLYVGPPDLHDRCSILQSVINSRSMPLSPSVDIQCLAKYTNMYSGADLANLIQEAGFAALAEGGMDVKCVEMRHFLAALSATKPSLNGEGNDQI